MSFPWPVNDKVVAFVDTVGGLFWHDTLVYVIPPTAGTPIYATYIPDPATKVLVIGLTFGDVLEYDPATGEFGPEIRSHKIGIWHACKGRMMWHWDPALKSIFMTNPYPQLLWCDVGKPYELLIVNDTDKTVWMDVTFWVVRFPKRVWCPVLNRYCDPEELWNAYMKGIVVDYVRKGVEGERT